MPLSISSTDAQKVTVIANPDGAGLDGALRVSVVDGDATFTQDPGSPLQFKAVSGAVGVSHFQVQGDRDLGPGEDLLSDTVEYTVTAAPPPPATTLGLAAGPVEPK